MAMTTMQWPDYVILALFLVISVGIGVYHSLTGGRQRTTQEFIMANRHLSILPTAISLFVSYQSAITVLGLTAEMYLYGVMYLVWSLVAFLLCTLLTERLIVPWIYPLKLVSVNDYFERRYDSKAVRILAAATGIFGATFYMGVAMYAPSAALENATGLPTSVSIPLMAFVSVLYTALGGMRAVIWTDVFQFVTMAAGTLAIMIKGFLIVGGLPKVLEICSREGRLVATNWSFDPTVRHTCWGFIFGVTLNWMKVYGLSQASVQRYSATQSLPKARITMLLNILALWVWYFIVCAIGLTVFAYYAMIGCDPLVNKDVRTPNQLLSLFVMTIFSEARGFAGLFLATLYGGALSSVSSSLSGAAANFWDDILKIWFDKMREQRKAIVNRLLVVFLGFFATSVAFVASVVPGPITQITIMFSSAINGPLVGMFLLGGISKHANWKGALVGCLFSQIINLWLSVGAFSTGNRHPILPPTSTAGCPARNTSSLQLSYNVTDAIMFYDEYQTTSLADQLQNTTSYFHDLDRPTASMFSGTAELTGLVRFYSLSYLWYTMFGSINCMCVGMLVSLIFRDKSAEAKVDDCLLIPFRQCLSWSSTNDKPSTGMQHNDEYTAVNNNNNDDHTQTVEQVPFEEVVHVTVADVRPYKDDTLLTTSS